MSFVCANLQNMWGSPTTYQLQAVASPSDFSTCSYIVMTGSDYKSLVSQISSSVSLADLQAQVSNLQTIVASYSNGSAIDYSQLAGFWGFGFSSVLTLWLVAYVAGRVLKPLLR